MKSLQVINDKADYIEQIADKLEECEKDSFVESAIILRANVNEILSYLGELEFCKESDETTGEWVDGYRFSSIHDTKKCSRCGTNYNKLTLLAFGDSDGRKYPNYCPNCGDKKIKNTPQKLI